MTPPRNFFSHLIAALGGSVVLTELGRHWLQGTPIEGAVIAIGFAFAFTGAYMADRKGALEGGGFLVDATTKIIAVVRSGRRSTDTPVVTTTEPTAPAAAPVVTWKDGKDEGKI